MATEGDTCKRCARYFAPAHDIEPVEHRAKYMCMNALRFIAVVSVDEKYTTL